MCRRLTIRRLVGPLVVALMTAACSSTGSNSSGASGSGWAERAATVATVEVKAQPTRLDDTGAAFTVVLDTHSGTLDADLGAGSRLEVNGTAWPAAGWNGDPAGGHHRTGTLRFSAAGPVAGTAILTIGGLAQPVAFQWDSAGG